MKYKCGGETSSKTEIEIFNGNQIGGCVTVIAYDDGVNTHRIMIDYGESLPGCDNDKFVYPWNEKPVDAVFFTHYHGDHAGRIAEIPENIPIYMGAVAKEVMLNIHNALAGVEKSETLHKCTADALSDPHRVKTFDWNGRCYESITNIPGFSVTPYSVDHSAYDSYMFLIETSDRKILHTGDFRGHGRRGKAIIPVINKYVRDYGKRNIDILITEGTMMSRKGEKVLTETEMQKQAEKLFQNNKYVFLICSSTNLDSLASFIKSAETNNIRTYCYSNYLCSQLKTFSETAGKFSNVYSFENIYTLDLERELISRLWDKPHTQKELMRGKGFLAIIKAEDYCEKYIDAFCDLHPVIVYSMWGGYMNPNHKAYNATLDDFIGRQKEKGIEVIHLHTSGHATPEFIADVINAVNPKEAIIPIHTDNAEAFIELKIDEDLKWKIRL